MRYNIPLSAPDITDAEIEAVTAVLRTNTLSIGPKATEFERALASLTGMPHAVAVSSGTAALHLAIRALNIGDSDEVIVPSFTFVAVSNAVLYERATPVFVDIDPLTYNIDPACVEAAITPRTRAIIAVHTFGMPAPMNAIMDIAKRYSLAVIEDACEAIGGICEGRPVGSFGDISIFAFYPNKQMTTGEGGALLTRSADIDYRVRALRNQGRYPAGGWGGHSELGYNYRLSEMACALGVVQLSRLAEMLAMRAEVAARYDALLAEIPQIRRPALTVTNGRISWFVYVVNFEDMADVRRDFIGKHLPHLGVGCARYFGPIHQQPAYRDLACARNVHLPVTEAAGKATLALPFFNRLSELQAGQVVDALREAIQLCSGSAL